MAQPTHGVRAGFLCHILGCISLGQVLLKATYKGIEYGLTDLGNDRWAWAFYSKSEGALAHRGEATGTREHAEMACMRAINAWLLQNAENGHLQANLHANESRVHR